MSKHFWENDSASGGEIPSSSATIPQGFSDRTLEEICALAETPRDEELARLYTCASDLSVDGIFIGAKRGLIKALQYFSSNNVPLTAKDGASRNILHWAAIGGSLDTIKFCLVSAHIDPNEEDGDGNTPLYYAALNSHGEIVRFFFSYPALNTNPINHNNCNILHAAVLSKSVDTIRTVLSMYGYSNEEQSNWDFMTMTTTSPRKRAKIDVNLQDFKSSMSPLLYAIDLCVNSPDLFAVSDLNRVDNKMNSAVHLAAKSNNVWALKYLLQKSKCSIDSKNSDSETPITLAIHHSHPEILTELLKLSKTRGNYLPICAASGSIEMAKAVMPFSDVNGVDENGITALMISVNRDDCAFIEFLLENPATDVNKANTTKQTALHIAARFNHIEPAKILVRASSLDPNVRDEDGWTPLHYACRNAHEEIVQLLLSLSTIDINIPDNRGKTPLYFCMNQNIRKMIDQKQQGAQ